MDKLIDQYGAIGVCLSALAIYLVRVEKRHLSERKEWRQTIEKQFDRLNEQTDESNKAIRENTGILQGLKTLLENKNRR